MKRIAFTTLGCKSNQYDGEVMREACRRAGFEVVAFDEPAEVYVINTCTVTALADAQGRQLVRRARRKSPDAAIIVVGCSSQNDPDAFGAMPEVDAVLGVRCVDALMRLLERRGASGIPPSVTTEGGNARGQSAPLKSETLHEYGVPTEQTRARALLKIQDGCDRRCTYCAVWRARGPSTSLSIDEVVERYRALGAYPEAMLTGIHIGQYGRDQSPATSLWDLLERLVQEEGGPRLRLGSLDPDEFDERLVDLMGRERLCRHVHLSVQSGSAGILKAMGRAYRPDDIARAVSLLARAVPGIAIGADLIAGFPGETESDHRATVELVEALPFTMVHVFPFSPRPGTVAAELPGEVPLSERKRRARELLEVGTRKRARFITSQIGAKAPAVVVSRKPDATSAMRAVTDNYINVRCPAGPDSYGRAVTVRIDSIDDGEVYALCG